MNDLPAVSPFENANDPTPNGRIDEIVFAHLRKVGISPARVCSDPVFVRRVFLDTIGTLPTAQETKTFLEDSNPNKRKRLIDMLLTRSEYADFWAMKWSDLLRVKSEFPINLWPMAAQEYHHWIRDRMADNTPYDQFVRTLLTASGSNFRVGPVNFYRAVTSKKPDGLASAVALTWMGCRTDKWQKGKLDKFAVFFNQIGFKATGEWKEEIVFWDASKATGLSKATFPDGSSVTLRPDQDPRQAVADWLISPKNPWFTQNIANRAWSWFLGRGIIHEPDDVRPDNPPVIPSLLTYLEHEMVAGGYDLKHLFRVILNSKTYQLSSIPRSSQKSAAANFAFYTVRPMGAEVLLDAINAISGTSEGYSSQTPEPYTFIPEENRTIDLPDGSVTSSFLELFGRASRDAGLESERNTKATVTQRLHMLNSTHMQRKLERGPGFVALYQAAKTPKDLAEKLYLTILSRYPTEPEMQILTDYWNHDKIGKRAVAQDVAWALINSAEFLYRH